MITLIGKEKYTIRGKYPPTGDWKKKCWYSRTMKYDPGVQINVLLYALKMTYLIPGPGTPLAAGRPKRKKNYVPQEHNIQNKAS